jgi:hypothetical protein
MVAPAGLTKPQVRRTRRNVGGQRVTPGFGLPIRGSGVRILPGALFRDANDASGDLMRAAVLRGGRVEVRETEDPVPGPGQILVRSRACGICASDLHFMDHPGADADDDTGLSRYDPDADIVMGHEYCAEVVDYGPGPSAGSPSAPASARSRRSCVPTGSASTSCSPRR